MGQLRRGQKLLCVPCGRQVTVGSAGISRTTIWCCGRPMGGGKRKSTTKKTAKKRK